MLHKQEITQINKGCIPICTVKKEVDRKDMQKK